MKSFSLAELPLRGKTVFVRVDFNVPLKNNKIADNYKIKASLPTIKFLLRKNCKIILAAHLGRPKGFDKNFKTDCLAKELRKLLKHKVIKLDDCIGKDIHDRIDKGKNKDIFMLENLRFYKEEEQNNLAFAHALADMADFYINNAFGVSHRKHASVHAITRFLPSAPGLLMLKEIKNLSYVLSPRRPMNWIIGGAKLDKLKLIENALKKANHILIGGALGFSFLKAKGYSIGMTKTDAKSIRLAKKILKKKISRKIVLPLDAVVAAGPKANPKVVPITKIPTSKAALDIGPLTVKFWKISLKRSKTIVWNGPLGYFESRRFEKGTRDIASYIAKLKATTIIGGGETSEAVRRLKLDKKMTHISTGGGATMEFISGKEMEGVQALENNYKIFRTKVLGR